MHIVVDIEDNMIRIVGQGFTVYVKNYYNFSKLIQHLDITSASFGNSFDNYIHLKEQLIMILRDK